MSALDFQINEDRIEERAEAVLREAGLLERTPVDPIAIAEREEIEVVGDDFQALFEGRLEYEPEIGFAIYFHQGAPGAVTPRERFSIAHELGHYFLHGARLREGGAPHDSQPDFTSETREEREADYFASCLLMPRTRIAPEVNEGDADLRRVLALAAGYGTSVTSSAIRFVRLSHFPCAVIVSRGGLVDFAWRSPRLREDGGGIGWTRRGDRVPPRALTVRAPPGRHEVLQDDLRASAWFAHKLDEDPWMLEQILDLGPRRLTLLSVDEEDLPGSDDDDEVESDASEE